MPGNPAPITLDQGAQLAELGDGRLVILYVPVGDVIGPLRDGVRDTAAAQVSADGVES